MVWRVHRWSADEGRGEVVSPHFGPWRFGPEENAHGVDDFAVGEEVFVELAGSPERYRVRSVIPTHARQPPGTHLTGFEAVNGCGDLVLVERSVGRLVFWAGDCCARCSPHAPLVVFHGVSSLVGWDEDAADFDPSLPLFRLASPEEVAAHVLVVPPGSNAYAIVTRHGQGPDGPAVLVVAQTVAVER